MFKINKWHKNIPIILIAITVIIILINYIYPILSDFYIAIIIFVVFFISFFIELLLDIKNRLYATSILIIIADALKITFLIAFCFFVFSSYDKTNIDFLIKRKLSVRILAFLVTLMITAKSLLEAKHFEKNNKI